MGAISFDDEYSSPVAPHRMFIALFLDAHNLMPKVIPSIKSIDFVSGDGGPGSVQQVNMVDESPLKYIKLRLDSKEEDNLVCKYTVIECDAFGGKIDCVSYELRFEADPNGGCIVKAKSTYHPKGDAILNEEEIKAGKEKATEQYKIIESYLVENPEIYA
ncbi:hypothetical protein C5167_040547 [Papaver somniferum]|uniref:Bet v I/Major latex protein domain-containing protein n=1 Tax=Papaver somniferum TaxID=3469 RepID=A0A4Y7IHP1_PAPSO|nr:pathogenesis-related protein STH-2-like [Papaver somniferum]RZC47596.1 hypothetical protein C5167_040547 [Papaver somniferum]